MIVVARVVLINYCLREFLEWPELVGSKDRDGLVFAELLCGVADGEFLERPGRVDLYLQSSTGKQAVAQVDEIRNSRQVSNDYEHPIFFSLYTAWVRMTTTT